jgi:hypothetical protein
MPKEAVFTMKLEPELRDAFMAAAAEVDASSRYSTCSPVMLPPFPVHREMAAAIIALPWPVEHCPR